MKKRSKQTPYVSCILAAAGKGTRMGAGINKIFLEYGGMPVLAHTLLAMDACRAICEIVIVAAESDLLGCKDIAEEFAIRKLKTITLGGDTRQASVRNALKAVSSDAEIVLIHDAARPLITEAVIQNVIDGVTAHGAAAAGVPCKNTLKIANEDGMITDTPDRSRLFEIQTPQGFTRDLIIRAHENALENNLTATDDCFLAEQLGAAIKIVPGDYRNIKITTSEDLLFAEHLMTMENDEREA